MMSEFQGGVAGEFVQSLILERSTKITNPLKYVYTGFGQTRLPGDETDLICQVQSFGSPFGYLRNAMPDQGDYYIGGFGFKTPFNVPIATLPSTGGFYRLYFYFRGVFGMFPMVGFTTKEEEFGKDVYGPPLGLTLSGVGPGSGRVTSGHTRIVTFERMDGVPPFFYPPEPFRMEFAFNAKPGGPDSGSYYMDRIVSVTFPGNGKELRLAGGSLDWKRVGVSSLWQGGSPPGRYPDGVPITFGQAVFPMFGTSFSFLRKNWYGHAKSLARPEQNIITTAELGDTTIDNAQFAEVQFLGMLPVADYQPEEYFEMTEPQGKPL